MLLFCMNLTLASKEINDQKQTNLYWSLAVGVCNSQSVKKFYLLITSLTMANVLEHNITEISTILKHAVDRQEINKRQECLP